MRRSLFLSFCFSHVHLFYHAQGQCWEKNTAFKSSRARNRTRFYCVYITPTIYLCFYVMIYCHCEIINPCYIIKCQETKLSKVNLVFKKKWIMADSGWSSRLVDCKLAFSIVLHPMSLEEATSWVQCDWFEKVMLGFCSKEHPVTWNTFFFFFLQTNQVTSFGANKTNKHGGPSASKKKLLLSKFEEIYDDWKIFLFPTLQWGGTVV